MTSPIVRMYFKRLTEDYYPDLVVVSYKRSGIKMWNCSLWEWSQLKIGRVN